MPWQIAFQSCGLWLSPGSTGLTPYEGQRPEAHHSYKDPGLAVRGCCRDRPSGRSAAVRSGRVRRTHAVGGHICLPYEGSGVLRKLSGTYEQPAVFRLPAVMLPFYWPFTWIRRAVMERARFSFWTITSSGTDSCTGAKFQIALMPHSTSRSQISRAEAAGTVMMPILTG